MEEGVNAGIQTEEYTHKITHTFSVFRPREEHPQIENVEKNYTATHFLVLRNILQEVREISSWQTPSTVDNNSSRELFDELILTKPSKWRAVWMIEDSQSCAE
jgi:hypothetical protein